MGRPRLLLPALLTLLTGCSGTPFGDQLARSFSEAPPAAAPPAVAPAQLDQTKPDQTSLDQTKSSPAQADPAKPKQPGSAPARPAQRPSAAAAPAPYRITLRLPGADPAAPAEAVTEALRAAGVSFEVEMIERVRSDGAAAPSSTPAPPPR
jgi:cell wall-associated NlpC family hydrolase